MKSCISLVVIYVHMQKKEEKKGTKLQWKREPSRAVTSRAEPSRTTHWKSAKIEPCN